MNFSSGNLNQVQLDMLGANQARNMQRSGKPFNKKATLGTVAAIAAVILLLAGILAATSSAKAYVYYNGTLYLDHSYETSYTEIHNLDGVEAGTMTCVSKDAKELSADFETNCEEFDGGSVYIIPGDNSQIIICTPEFEFYRLVPAG